MNWIASIFALAIGAIALAAITDSQFTALQGGSVYAMVGLCTP